MLAGLVGIFTVLLLVVMSTLGCVLLVAFVMGKSGFRVRVATAMIAGPGVMLLPMLLLAAGDIGGDGLAAMLGFSFLGALACGFIGWPVAHIATRRLDRLIQFDIGTFE
ncbi:MAG: hypothetical protein ACX930_02960 [Erythrobacter sp.]